MLDVAVTGFDKCVFQKAVEFLFIDLLIIRIDIFHGRQVIKRAAPLEKIVIAAHQDKCRGQADHGFKSDQPRKQIMKPCPVTSQVCEQEEDAGYDGDQYGALQGNFGVQAVAPFQFLVINLFVKFEVIGFR